MNTQMYHNASFCIIFIVLHHIVSYRIVSYHIVSYHNPLLEITLNQRDVIGHQSGIKNIFDAPQIVLTQSTGGLCSDRVQRINRSVLKASCLTLVIQQLGAMFALLQGQRCSVVQQDRTAVGGQTDGDNSLVIFFNVDVYAIWK